ncbi:hypothetical protein U9M48_034640, partial [Paspalum notatum var. saurae]
MRMDESRALSTLPALSRVGFSPPCRVQIHQAFMERWWTNTTIVPSTSKIGLRSLIILVCWEIWKERNNQVFNRSEAPFNRILNKIKDEAHLWSFAGAKAVADLAWGLGGLEPPLPRGTRGAPLSPPDFCHGRRSRRGWMAG